MNKETSDSFRDVVGEKKKNCNSGSSFFWCKWLLGEWALGYFIVGNNKCDRHLHHVNRSCQLRLFESVACCGENIRLSGFYVGMYSVRYRAEIHI